MGQRSRGHLCLLVLGTLVLAACQKGSDSRTLEVKPATPENTPTTQALGNGESGFQAVNHRALKSESVKLLPSPEAVLAIKSIAKSDVMLGNPLATTPNVKEDSLILGFPIGLIGQHQVFGGVITKVSDGKSEKLGRLKLTDLTPIHVRTEVVRRNEGVYDLGLLGCLRDCAEGSREQALVGLPVIGIDLEKAVLFLDLTGLGDDLKLVEMLDPGGSYTEMKTQSSKVTSMDYSYSTLVFDVESEMVPKSGETTSTGEKKTTFTARWYLKLTSGFNPNFITRLPTDGVGFFQTERSETSVIQRFNLPYQVGSLGGLRTIHYYLKNVPAEFKAAFSESFDGWNREFKEILGKNLLSYEFVDAADPRNALLIPGDARFNILEWDLVNIAPYGGLGPSIANQYTGEIFSANVLIQGPTILTLYKAWFGISSQFHQLVAMGKTKEANDLLLNFNRKVQAQQREDSQVRYSLSLGSNLVFRIASQMPEYEDPISQKESFDPVPAGYDFSRYMHGYFLEMVEHELGHNLGLRHNFRGNLYAAPEIAQGKVSVSVMEYLGRAFRYVNQIASYDTMAIAYGYKGQAPERKDQFCTDEHVPDESDQTLSAECSRDDATSDPYGFFEKRLTRSIQLLVQPSSTAAPAHKVKDIQRDLGNALNGLGLYAATAESTFSSWTNFAQKFRPTAASDVKAFVQDSVKRQICDPALNQAAEAKETPEAKQAVLENLADLRKFAAEKMAAIQAFTSDDLKCE